MPDKHLQNRLAGSVTVAEDRSIQALPPGGGYFEIHVRGHLNGKWSDWLEGLDIELLENGEMILSGAIADQAALLGVLNKLNRLNLALLSVNEVNRNQEYP